MKYIFLISGIISSLYGLLVLLIIGVRSIFNFVFLLLGVLLLLIYFFYDKLLSHKDKILFKVITVLVGICLVIFTITEIRIIDYSNNAPESNADYVILLGSQVRKDGPSRDFYARIKAASEYLKDNPESIVITTGGKGSNEPIAEGQAAYTYLVNMGIPEDRILIEDKSTNTFENIKNSKKIIEEAGDDPSECKIVIVSSTFHLFRASYIADKLGFNNISGKGSNGLKILNPHYYTREFFGLIKDYVLLNIIERQ